MLSKLFYGCNRGAGPTEGAKQLTNACLDTGVGVQAHLPVGIVDKLSVANRNRSSMRKCERPADVRTNGSGGARLVHAVGRYRSSPRASRNACILVNGASSPIKMGQTDAGFWHSPGILGPIFIAIFDSAVGRRCDCHEGSGGYPSATTTRARDIVRRLFVCAMMAQPTRLQSS